MEAAVVWASLVSTSTAVPGIWCDLEGNGISRHEAKAQTRASHSPTRPLGAEIAEHPGTAKLRPRFPPGYRRAACAPHRLKS